MAMMHEPDDSGPVDRLYVRLAAALRQSRPNPFGAPVTVAEIYQELVPYRLVRADAGFDMNADYEHALLRLLAGEGECVRLEPSAARDAIRRELRSNNPNVGMYREYAGCDVWVSEPAFTPAPGSIFALADEDADTATHGDTGADPDSAQSAWPATRSDVATDVWLDEAEDDAADEAGTQPAATTDPWSTGTAAETDGAPAEAPAETRAETRAEAPAEAPADSTGDTPSSCRFCDSPLPTNRPVRFCPWCGADQTTQPCASCGEPMDADWLFCVACGARPVA